MENKDLKRNYRSDKDWYKKIWTLDIQNQSWVDETTAQVDFICKVLGLTGNENVLDLACGFGRHSLELGKRGCKVVGVDITKSYIDEARRQARNAGISNEYYCNDIRELNFTNEFDIVLNLADGAIGYLEDDEENEKVFCVAAKALRKDGKHLIDICNGGYAVKYFPCRNWQYGKKSLALSDFTWNNNKRIMYFGGIEIPYDEKVKKEHEIYCDPTRLYTIQEIKDIGNKNNMSLQKAYGDFQIDKEATDDVFQIQVVSIKK